MCCSSNTVHLFISDGAMHSQIDDLPPDQMSSIPLKQHCALLADEIEKVSLLICSIDESQNLVPCVSQLWTGVHTTAEQDTPLTQSDPRAMERHHGIQPNVSKKKYENPWKYDPLKVQYRQVCLL